MSILVKVRAMKKGFLCIFKILFAVTFELMSFAYYLGYSKYSHIPPAPFHYTIISMTYTDFSLHHTVS